MQKLNKLEQLVADVQNVRQHTENAYGELKTLRQGMVYATEDGNQVDYETIKMVVESVCNRLRALAGHETQS